MAFIAKAIGGVAKAFGLVKKFSAPAAPPVAPTVDNSAAQLDAAAQAQAAAMAGGRSSTILNGADGIDDTKKTSRILLGQ